MTLSQDAVAGYISWRGIARGGRRLAPITLFVFCFGLAFGVAATGAGLSPGLTAAMSGLVFAGASQLAVLDLWGVQVPLLPLVLITFAVNARHLLMGASLYVWFRELPPARRFAAAAMISDVNWAMALAAYRDGERDLGLLVGGGLVMWITWLVSSWLGATFGRDIADPAAWGLDVVVVAFIAALLPGLWKGRASVLPWLVAAGVAVASAEILSGGWHIIVGALAGGLVGGWRDDA